MVTPGFALCIFLPLSFWVFLFVCLFWQSFMWARLASNLLHSCGWPYTLVLLPPLSKSWDCRHTAWYLVPYVGSCQKLSFWGCGGGSLGKIFAMQAWAFKFTAQHSFKKLGMVARGNYPSAGKVETERPWARWSANLAYLASPSPVRLKKIKR